MQRKRARRAMTVALAAGTIMLSGCAAASDITDGTTSSSSGVAPTDRTECADVVEVAIAREDSGTYRFDVTVHSPDTGEEKYADLWEVRAPDGTVLGERILTHPHVEEQPFTRSQGGIEVPAEHRSVAVVARDSVAGFCGKAVEIEVP